MPYDTYPYELPPLPYEYYELEPYIDTETMHYHHDNHFQTYINNLNKALEPYQSLQKLTLTQLLSNPSLLPPKASTAIMRSGGGVYNHAFFFNGLAPSNAENHQPEGKLLSMINQTFSSFENFKNIFSQQALDVFGSGWTCLSLSPLGALEIINLKNQNTLLVNNSKLILLFDVWEHAYYLKYKYLRADYIQNLWSVVTFPSL